MLSNNMSSMALALNKAIDEDKQSESKALAKQGNAYYNYEHDILQNRIFYMDNNGVLKEDKYASNIKIPHAFLTELVDQKVQYLLSLPVQVGVDDDKFRELLEEYYDEEMQLFLQEMVEGTSLKGYEYAYARTNVKDRLQFQVSDYIKTFTVYDEFGNPARIVRYYDKNIDNVVITFAEIWTDTEVYYFKSDKHGKFSPDTNRELNPRPHVLAIDETGQTLGRGYGKLPYFKLANNKFGQTDLEPIKALIDDYDLMACFLSNNLQDFSEAIYVVKGFQGDDLDVLRSNIKAKKTVGVGDNGGVEIKTVEIPVEARKTKLEIDRQAIYKFGMGFDSTQIGDSTGNVTNVAIQSGYSLLNMKCNKAEVRLRTLIAWMNELIVDDINRRHGTYYNASDITVTMERETMTDQKENAEIEKIEADTKLVIIQALLSVAPRLDSDTVLKLICEQYALDFDEVKLLIEEQEYQSLLDFEEDEINGEEDEELLPKETPRN